MKPPRSLEIPREIVEQVIAQARRESPLEACGLMSGRESRVLTVHPLMNEAASATEYLAAEGLFEPFRQMRETNEELLAIYHSHPSAEAVPSKKDLERNYYPGIVHVIVSLIGPAAVVRGFLLEPDRYDEVELRVLDLKPKQGSGDSE